MTRSPSPIACDMNALTSVQRQRYDAIARLLQQERQGVEETSDGYAFRFLPDAETIRNVNDFVILERLCCPFLAFTIQIESDGGPLWLNLTGREGVKEFLRAELGLA
jgi:hypothetical protein